VTNIKVERNGMTATIVLDRGDKLNALTKAMWSGLGEVMEALGCEPGLRCIVLRGAGRRAFSVGADIAEFQTQRAGIAKGRVYGSIMNRAIAAIRDCPVPVVAMIHGLCVGGGLEIAALADIRICGESSRFGAPIAKLGLVMGHVEMAALIALVGRARTLEIVLEARIYGATEAHAMGLVSRVVPDADVEAETAATVARILAGAPLAARWHKKFAARLAEPSPPSPAEADEAYACFATRDFEEGYRAFLNKVPPVFTGH
jgi:enoyl-CoA hydratase/carnithine racemase